MDLTSLSSFSSSPPPSPIKGEGAKGLAAGFAERPVCACLCDAGRQVRTRTGRRTPNSERYRVLQKGFTTIELIISIVILGILGVYTFSFLGDSMGAYVRVKEHKTLYDEGRLAMEYMVREIRDANQTAAITVVSNTSITFTKLHPSAMTITYSLTSGTLNRVYSGTFALAGRVQTFSPTVSGTAPNQLVTLDLTLSGRGVIRIRTTIYPRNNV